MAKILASPECAKLGEAVEEVVKNLAFPFSTAKEVPASNLFFMFKYILISSSPR
jgi:hypothetical protein